MMIFAFVGTIIAYIGIIRMQREWYKHNLLTEGNFVLFQAPICSLLVLTGALMISTSFENRMMAVVLSLLCSIIGYPTARLIYRQRIAPK